MKAAGKVRNVLLDAASRIEKKGWMQGHRGTREQALCAGLAITEAIAGGGDDRGNIVGLNVELEQRAHRVFRTFVGSPRVSTYNDAPGRTKQEVVAALRACAADVAPDD